MTDGHEGPIESATLGGGCFWCVEACLARLDGVIDVTPGYSGGTPETADYRTVCSGATDHAEVVQVRFDPTRVSYRDLLAVFFKAHDPTTKDRQGNDVGRQYRSVIFAHDDAQREEAERVVRELEGAGVFGAPVVTEIAPLESFHPAEEAHHDYFARNPGQGYCRVVIAPKVAKIEQALAAAGQVRG